MRYTRASCTSQRTSLRHGVTQRRAYPGTATTHNQQHFPNADHAHRAQLAKKASERFMGQTGGQIFHSLMRENGVKTVFGYPGGAILPVFDAIYESPHFEFILTRHEQGAGHMAEGYARATGKPGVVIVTSGPGGTNTITPMQDALMDGTPMVVFAGQVVTSAIGSDAFQEADIIGISRPCTKWNHQVRDIADLPKIVNEAFRVATTGRPGPVLIDLPKDVTAGTLHKPCSPPLTHVITEQKSGKFTRKEIAHAAKLINMAKKPVLYVGQGAVLAEAHELVAELAKKAHIPVTTTIQGLGAYDEHDYLSLHMLGMHGAAYANYAMQKADLIIAVGARFDDRCTGRIGEFAPEAKKAEKEGRGGIIHFDIYPRNIHKVVPATVPILGDCKEALQHLVPHVNSVVPEERKEWFDQIDSWKQKHPFSYTKAVAGEKLKPQTVIEELNKQADMIGKDKVFITTGVGQHQMWAAQYYRWRHPRTMITSGGLGTMGYGLPAAIGAKLGAPDKIVVDIDGDGSFCMTAMELATAVQFKIGVKVLLLNNDFQGMVKQWQELFYDSRYSATRMVNPDFVAMCHAFGMKAIRVTEESQLESAMAEFLNYDGGPILLEAVVTSKEHVLPMVAVGKALHEMVLPEDLAPYVPDKTVLPPS